MEVVFAPVASLADRLPPGAKVLVLASSDRHVAPLRAALGARAITVFDQARVHVPIETVDAATKVLVASGADTVIAIGGGSPVGLGKALRLTHRFHFVAIPTTYAGSEMTTMFGITRERDKQTGRDERVRPDLVIYDVALTLGMPLGITVQSLFNALAHVVSVLSTDSLPEAARAPALTAAHDAVAAIEALVGDPKDRAAREAAQRAASACAAVFDQGKPGVHHGIAHLLGGALDLEHAALHALLLPRFIGHLSRTRPFLAGELEQAIGDPQPTSHERPTMLDLSQAASEAQAASQLSPLGARLLRVLVAAGAPVTLRALGVDRGRLDQILATKPELPAQLVIDAY